MRALTWMVAGVGIGVGVTLLMKLSEPEYATGYDDVERAAAKSFGWGTKKRAEGRVRSGIGSVKEAIGRVVSDPDLENEGTFQRAKGKVKETIGEVGQGIGQTIHDLNR